MKTQNSFSVSFFLKKDKDKVSNGMAPLYARITVNGDYKDLSLKRRVALSTWNQKEQKLDGNTEECKAIKEKMRQVRNEINAAYDDMRYQKDMVTAEALKAKVEGTDEEQHTLSMLIKYHNEELSALLEPGTMKNYYSTERFIKEFLKLKKKRNDIYLAQIDHKFITDFSLFLLHRKPDVGQRPCSNNTVMKHMERLKKMFGVALKNKWMINDPFIAFERKIIRKDREALEMEELDRIKDLYLEHDGHAIVRDMYLFCSYTGLSYSDLLNFNHSHIVKDADGELWLEMTREKTRNFTEKKFFVLLLPEAIDLIDKYKYHPASINNGTIFPKYSNQTVNRYIKLIVEQVNINRKVTFHVARHTFATTITLENGVTMESVSKMLGHASIRTTEIYSKVKKKKVANDMIDLRRKMTTKLAITG
ncbi:MAG: site-specific integrase [Flavobacterium sp.]|nr:MAG: site-specific integrase [Flavobacterium sp.]